LGDKEKISDGLNLKLDAEYNSLPARRKVVLTVNAKLPVLELLEPRLRLKLIESLMIAAWLLTPVLQLSDLEILELAVLPLTNLH